MRTDNWQKIKELFNATIELPETERESILEKIDSDLRDAVEKLLHAHEQANNFIVEPAVVEIGLADENEFDLHVGTQIDSYKILREIGHGGMGTVYLAARDDDFEKQVAVKLIKRGMDTNAVLKRFVVERQILANLEHPNIASLLDGGSTADGLPYLVMEYIEGEIVTKFCDSHQFSTEERLKLFQEICGAVSYAHQNLVVHRDLKPSNILVTEAGVPKLLDFGIAKLLHPDWSLETAEATATMFRLMTPEYASPEQMRGLPITTASDVYSLGVVLYELLTGERPYKIESRLPEEAAQIVLNAVPPKPSSVISSKPKVQSSKTVQQSTQTVDGANQQSKTQNLKSLRGDLDNIILKSLRKEPERRYASVQEFSQDIRRHLAGLPVSATADTTFYRAGKFLKRHRLGVFAGLLIALTLISATIVTSWQAVVASRERNRAEQRFNQVRKLANTVLFDYHERIKNLPGSTETRKKLVTDALEYLDNLAQTSDNSPDLQRELALAYQKVGDIQGGFVESANTGESNAALENYRKALAIQERLVSQSNNPDADRNTLAKLYINVGEQLAQKGDFQSQVDFCQRAVAIRSEIAQKSPQNTTVQADLAVALSSLASAVRAKGDYDGAILNFRQAANIYQELALVDEGAERRGTRLRNAALTYKSMGGVFEQKQDFVSALELYRKAIAIDQANAAANPNNAQYQLDLSFTLNSIASSLTNQGNFNEAQENCRKALEIQEKTAAADPKNAFAQTAVARTYRRMGDILKNLEKFEEASINYQKAIKMFEEFSNADPSNVSLKVRLAEVYSVYGDCHYYWAKKAKSKSEQITGLRQAEKYNQRSIDIYLALQTQNSLTPRDAKNLVDVEKSLEIDRVELKNLLTK
ncbi:MAG: serine/threonine-protein kinase [Pyrinomonadaceae bacterium]